MGYSEVSVDGELVPCKKVLENLDTNPANDPWRNGMTDDQLMNLITLKGAKDLYGKAKGTGLFNLEQDLDLQNLGLLSDLEMR